MNNKSVSQSQTEGNPSNLHQSSISHMSGFSHIKYSEQRNYFKRIKYKNLDKYRQATWNERAEICSKFFFHIISNLINLLNIIIFIYQSYSLHLSKTYYILSVIDLACGIYFLLEYTVNLFINKNSIIKFIFSFDSFIDLFSIIPTIVNFFIDNPTLRAVFRMLKVFRVLRIYKSVKTLQYENNDSNFLGFISNFQFELIGTILVFFSFFFISSGLILGIQDLVVDAFNQGTMNYMEAVYFMLITTSTLGYGDIYPTQLWSRLFIVLVIVGFISVVSYQIGKFVQLLQLWSNYTKFSFKNHIILICDSSIQIDYVLKELKKENHRQIILIISKDIENNHSNEFPYNAVHILNTQEIDLEIFERANVKAAKSILIYSNLSFNQYEQSEKVNEFTLLKINEYYNIIPTYIQVLYSERSFSHSLDAGKSMVVKQNMTKINELGLSENTFKINKLIPILRIKNLIVTKAAFNPGYAAFAQNLIFNNDTQVPINLEGFDMPTQAYFLGCENKIIIRKFPRYFIGKNFFEALRLIYSKSITNYLTEIALKNNTEVNRPIMLIGIIDNKRSNFFTSNNKTVKLFPRNQHISGLTPGIFISYNEQNYVNKILDLFNQEKDDDDIELNIDKDNENNTINKEKKNDQLDDSFIRTEINAMRRKAFCGGIIPSPIPNNNNTNPNGDISPVNKINIFKTPSNTNSNNIICSESCENESDVRKTSTKQIYLRNKTRFATNKMKYNDLTTKNNVLLLQSFNDKNLFTIESNLIQKIKKRYDSTNTTPKSELFYENRILNISKHSYSSLLNKHILIIGYQDGMVKLLKILFYHFPTKPICILPIQQMTLDDSLTKLMMQFSNLFVLNGQMDNPFHLLNANASKAFFVIFLQETIHEKVNEDIMKILSMKTFDYFFNQNSIMEILQPSTLKFFGYNIINNHKSLRSNEFLHPSFMSGNVLFLNQFNRLLCMSAQGNDMEVDSWLELISLGLKNTISPTGRLKPNGVPLTITLDVPDLYNGKEFHNLMADLLCLSTPVLILGIYVTQPIEYMRLRSEGCINRGGHVDKGKINITTSHNMFHIGELITHNEYIKTLRRLKALSYNDKIYLDSIDIKHPFTPIFLTNPPPWFILAKNTKMLVLYNYIPQVKKKNLQVFQQDLIKKLNEKYENVRTERIERKKLDHKQEYMHGIMSLLKKRIEEQFNKAYKNLEIKHQRKNNDK